MESKDLSVVEKNEGLSIVVDDGRIAVPISNTLGEKVGTFYFNPADIGIVDRFRVASERFTEVVEPLNELPDDSTIDDKVVALTEARKRLYEVCDYLFGGNLSEAFFGSVDPFSPIEGTFYCEKALNAVAEFVSNRFEMEAKKVNAHVEKYTRDYQKKSGKHKDGYR